MLPARNSTEYQSDGWKYIQGEKVATLAGEVVVALSEREVMMATFDLRLGSGWEPVGGSQS